METTFSAVDRRGEDHRWLILGVIAIAQLMIVLDATIMNIALPSAQKALHFSVTDRQWVVTAYALAFGSLLLLGGKLANVIGQKITFIIGLIGFAAASAVGGAAANFEMLVTARAAQGAFAALLAPAALSLLATTFRNPAERGRAFGVYGAVAGSGGAVGLLLGGVLTEYLSWRWCLYVNLLFAALAVAGAVLWLTHERVQHRPKIDVPGAVLVSGGMFCIVYGFSNAGSHSWGTPSTWGFLFAGAALLVAFVLWEARTAEPLLPLRIWADRTRAGGYLAMLFAGAGLLSVLLFLTFFMQQNMGYSPVRTGVAFLPMVAATMAFTQLSTVALMPRIGPRPLVAIGMLLGGGSALWLTRVGANTTYAAGILPAALLIGAGLGFIYGPVADAGTAGVPPRDSGVASATVNQGNQLGGSIGTSLLNTLFAGAITTYIAAHAHGRPSSQVIAAATLHGYHTAFWWALGIFAVGAVVCGALMRSGPLPGMAPQSEQQSWTPPLRAPADRATEPA